MQDTNLERAAQKDHLTSFHVLFEALWEQQKRLKDLQTPSNSKAIAMEFDISKCAHVTMKARKLVVVGGMERSTGEVIPKLESDKDYKYLGIFEPHT